MTNHWFTGAGTLRSTRTHGASVVGSGKENGTEDLEDILQSLNTPRTKTGQTRKVVRKKVGMKKPQIEPEPKRESPVIWLKKTGRRSFPQVETESEEEPPQAPAGKAGKSKSHRPTDPEKEDDTEIHECAPPDDCETTLIKGPVRLILARKVPTARATKKAPVAGGGPNTDSVTEPHPVVPRPKPRIPLTSRTRQPAAQAKYHKSESLSREQVMKGLESNRGRKRKELEPMNEGEASDSDIPLAKRQRSTIDEISKRLDVPITRPTEKEKTIDSCSTTSRSNIYYGEDGKVATGAAFTSHSESDFPFEASRRAFQVVITVYEVEWHHICKMGTNTEGILKLLHSRHYAIPELQLYVLLVSGDSVEDVCGGGHEPDPGDLALLRVSILVLQQLELLMSPLIGERKLVVTFGKRFHGEPNGLRVVHHVLLLVLGRVTAATTFGPTIVCDVTVTALLPHAALPLGVMQELWQEQAYWEDAWACFRVHAPRTVPVVPSILLSLSFELERTVPDLRNVSREDAQCINHKKWTDSAPKMVENKKNRPLGSNLWWLVLSEVKAFGGDSGNCRASLIIVEDSVIGKSESYYLPKSQITIWGCYFDWNRQLKPAWNLCLGCRYLGGYWWEPKPFLPNNRRIGPSIAPAPVPTPAPVTGPIVSGQPAQVVPVAAVNPQVSTPNPVLAPRLPMLNVPPVPLAAPHVPMTPPQPSPNSLKRALEESGSDSDTNTPRQPRHLVKGKARAVHVSSDVEVEEDVDHRNTASEEEGPIGPAAPAPADVGDPIQRPEASTAAASPPPDRTKHGSNAEAAPTSAGGKKDKDKDVLLPKEPPLSEKHKYTGGTKYSNLATALHPCIYAQHCHGCQKSNLCCVILKSNDAMETGIFPACYWCHKRKLSCRFADEFGKEIKGRPATIKNPRHIGDVGRVIYERGQPGGPASRPSVAPNVAEAEPENISARTRRKTSAPQGAAAGERKKLKDNKKDAHQEWKTRIIPIDFIPEFMEGSSRGGKPKKVKLHDSSHHIVITQSHPSIPKFIDLNNSSTTSSIPPSPVPVAVPLVSDSEVPPSDPIAQLHVMVKAQGLVIDGLCSDLPTLRTEFTTYKQKLHGEIMELTTDTSKTFCEVLKADINARLSNLENVMEVDEEES
ncbi:hypothetical protein JAAARDRAFT_51749 [Jaapia argillacea MUCL 33604]|uniref:Zn(2)-C6 fungal-type domain-containing protein n=1 Tax=Jaapia argillacea MUCL 33604 TaxID=933084 RepID=A0A067PEM5_9AGAM|nr:hypothetical protein JAAARDRAFT_51749 [Jaapia argillacea MUCL 33604]